MNFIDLQAAIGRVQLRRQPEFQGLRSDIAGIYREALKSLDPQVQFQHGVMHPYHSRHLFTVRLPLERMRISRDEFLLQLREMNVGASIHYAPLHTMPLYGAPHSSLPETERVAASILTLPIGSSMNMRDAWSVTEAFKEVFSRAIS